MGKEILTFHSVEIEKNKFYHHKCPEPLREVHMEKALVSNKISSGEKNYKSFIAHLYNDDKVKPLHVMLPKTSIYVKGYDGQTKWIYFFIKDVDLLEKINSFWDKVSTDIKQMTASLSTIKYFENQNEI